MDPYPLLYTIRTPNLSLATWEAYDPSIKVHLTSTALRLGRELFIFDPIPLPEETDPISEGATPTAILLTNGNHERASLAFATEWRIPVYAESAALAECSPDLRRIARPLGVLEEGALPFKPVSLPGGAEGETAYYIPEEGGIAIVGDALIHLPATGFCLLPEQYCTDVVALRDAVEQLAALNPHTMTFAHGRPLVGTAEEPLAEKIARLPGEG